MSVLEQLRSSLGDRYEVERQIGEGGMATVYRAMDRKHGRAVAIKVFRPELAASMGTERFVREIEVSAKLQHPHVVPLYDSGAAGGLVYYVMPFVEGESLRERLDRDGRIPLDEALTLAREVASALQYAHDQGLVHRDIKPENIMLSGGHAIVADFGIARAVSAARQQDNPRLTGMGFAVGTPAYMSPEQATASEVDGQSDQYSLACVFYEMVTGQIPFSGPTVQAVLTRSLTGPRPRLSKATGSTPAEADPVVARALDGDPAQRYPSVSAFAEALSAAGGGQAASSRLVRRLTGAVGVLAVALLALLATRMLRGGGGGPVRDEAASIAVLPFTASGAGVEMLGEGMVDLLSTNLNAVGGIRTVEPRLVLNQWRERPGAGDVASGLDLARRMKANSIVLGSLVAAGTRVRISATLHGPDGSPLATAQVDGPQDSVLPLVDDLSVQLVRGIWQSKEPVPSLRVSGITTGSLDAMKAYLEGERHYRRSRWDSAQSAFGRAVELDSTFSLAHFRLAASHGWQGGYGTPRATQASAAARRFADRLPPRERALVVGYDLFSRGRIEAADSMRRYVAEYPSDADGWFVLGESLYHNRWSNALPPDSVRAPFDRVLALDSSLAPAAIHPAELALMSRDSRALAPYVRVMRAAGSGAEADAFAAADALVHGGVGVDSAMRVIGTRQGTIASIVFGGLGAPAATSDSFLALAVPVWNAVAAQAPAVAGQMMLARAISNLTFGRFAEARQVADSLRAVDQNLAYSVVIYPAMIGIPTDSISAGPIERMLSGRRINPYQVHSIAHVSLVRGDVALAERLVDSVLARDSTGSDRYLHGLMLAAKGRIQVVRGDTTAGIASLRRGIEQTGGFNPYLTAAARLALAEALVGRPATREEGLNRFRYGFETDGGLSVYASFVLGRALEAAGDTPGAVAAYSRFLRFWDKPTGGGEALAGQARAALRQLTGEGRPLVP